MREIQSSLILASLTSPFEFEFNPEEIFPYYYYYFLRFLHPLSSASSNITILSTCFSSKFILRYILLMYITEGNSTTTSGLKARGEESRFRFATPELQLELNFKIIELMNHVVRFGFGWLFLVQRFLLIPSSDEDLYGFLLWWSHHSWEIYDWALRESTWHNLSLS